MGVEKDETITVPALEVEEDLASEFERFITEGKRLSFVPALEVKEGGIKNALLVDICLCIYIYIYIYIYREKVN